MRVAMDRRLIVALALVAGCENSASDCKVRAGELAHYLATMDHEPEAVPGYLLDELHLVRRTDLPRGAVARLPFIEVSPTRVVFAGKLIAIDEQLVDEMKREARALEDAIASGRISGTDKLRRRLLLVVDQAADWGMVVRIAELAASAGFDHLGFLFARPAATPPPPRSVFDDELDALTARRHPTRLIDPHDGDERERIWSKVLRSCDSVRALFATVNSSGQGDKAEMLIRGIAPALIECNCDVDMPSLRSGMWRLIGQPHPTSQLEIVLERDASRIDQASSTPWREASKQLRPGQTAWLVAH